jgi:hypothetical protein
VIENISDGMRAGITFHIRLYRRATGPFSFLGDRLIAEEHPEFEAKWDVFTNHYVLRGPGGRERRFRDRKVFVEQFFSLSGYRLTDAASELSDEHYILVQVALEPVKLVPPVNLVSLFSQQTMATSPWVEARLIGTADP